MTMFVIFVCAILAKFTLAYNQSDYSIVHHRLELVYYNHKHVQEAKASLVPVNRTCRAINATFTLKRDITEVQLSFQVYRFASNEYRLFPMYMSVSFCSMQSQDTFGTQNLAQYSTIKGCPVKKGNHYINQYRPDETRFPPHLVPGDYKVVLNITSMEKLAEVNWYGSVKKVENLWN